MTFESVFWTFNSLPQEEGQDVQPVIDLPPVVAVGVRTNYWILVVLALALWANSKRRR